jgi:hypothetical protein
MTTKADRTAYDAVSRGDDENPKPGAVAFASHRINHREAERGRSIEEEGGLVSAEWRAEKSGLAARIIDW